jgi:MoaA/NifB/PqqE/SkfB family radical SAM enzyme
MSAVVPATRLMRKRRPAVEAITPRSVALFRLGEICNNHCPMCSNSGRPAAWKTPADDLLRRVAFLQQAGMRRVVVTGGEPTIHPAFWTVVEALNEAGITWDINTHGRSFADRAFSRRAIDEGLQRAIVSFHSHEVGPSREISGITEKGHWQTIAGVEHLLADGAWVMLNTVLSTLNVGHLPELVAWCGERFGHEYTMKVAFPTTSGKGGDWAPIHLRYRDVLPAVQAARDVGEALGIKLVFEGFPNCVLGERYGRNVSRSGFGETHYLDDITGDQLYPIRTIEAALSCYPETCRGCAALPRCPGVAEGYARRVGVDELVPFERPRATTRRAQPAARRESSGA